MTFSPDGLIAQFLSILGVQITSADGYYIAFVVSSALSACVVVALMVLIFRFLCYIRRG